MKAALYNLILILFFLRPYWFELLKNTLTSFTRKTYIYNILKYVINISIPELQIEFQRCPWPALGVGRTGTLILFTLIISMSACSLAFSSAIIIMKLMIDYTNKTTRRGCPIFLSTLSFHSSKLIYTRNIHIHTMSVGVNLRIDTWRKWVVKQPLNFTWTDSNNSIFYLFFA